MAEERKRPSILLSFLFALAGVGCIGASVYMMPWIRPGRIAAAEKEPVRTAGKFNPSPATDALAEKMREPALSAVENEERKPPAGNAPAEKSAVDTGTGPGGIATKFGPWVINLVPDNYSLTTKGWESVREIRALLLSNKNVSIGLTGTANIMKSKKRAAHAAKIVKDRISQEDPDLASRMSISANLSEKEHGLSVSVTAEGLRQ